jgi:hypothetical protein
VRKGILFTNESITASLSEMGRAAIARDLDSYMALFSPKKDVLFVYNGEVFLGVEAIAETH